MSVTNQDASSRYTSGSHSAGHSPAGSPGTNQRKLGAPNVFGMAAPSGLKGLNSGWQVWGSSNGSSKRNASVSSVPSMTDISQTQTHTGGDVTYQTWNPRSGNNWDDVNGGSQKETNTVAFNPSRQRQLGSARIDDRSNKPSQFSPQRFDKSLSKDSGRYASSSSPTKPFGNSSPFSAQQQLANGTMYDSVVDNELALGMRGMVVEDDFAGRGQAAAQQAQFAVPHIRAAPQGRSPYGPDYANAYYAGAHGSYTYNGTDQLYASSPAIPSAPSPQAMYAAHPHAMSELHSPQTGVFYDARTPGSQYYYHTPQMMYHTAPSHSPMMTPSVPSSIADKKRELQLGHVYATMRSSPSPHSPAFPIDYSSQMAMMVPGLYGPGNPMFAQGVRTPRRDGESTPLRSPLLEEFRTNKTRKWELRDIFGYIVEFSGDQHGSRFIQQKLESATSDEKEIIFNEIVPHNALQLIQDVFGNYVIQKLFEYGTQVQKLALASTMEGHVLQLSLQMYGCRVVQKAIEYILPDQQAAFVRELDSHVLKCVKDANGNHVIQKLIERVSADKLEFVNSFRGNVYELSTHPYGCRVLQRCFEHLPDEQTRPLLDELHKYIANLMQDQFGNYVVQFVLEHGSLHDRKLIINKLRGQMLNMARHKFASNVCEKALVTADPESRYALIDEIMCPKQDGVTPIVTMMKDQFANYVLQRAISVAEGEQKQGIIDKVRPQLVNMRRYSSAYSKHLISIERLLEKCSGVPLNHEEQSDS